MEMQTQPLVLDSIAPAPTSAPIEEKKSKKKYPKNKVYDKFIVLDHNYGEHKAQTLKNALEAEWQKYVYIDKKYRPNDKLEEVTTSHEINVVNVNGKINVNFITRTRDSCPRYNNKLIKAKAIELFGPAMPPTSLVAKDTAPATAQPDEPDQPESDIEDLSDDNVSEISSVPSIPKLTRQVACSELRPQFNSPIHMDEPQFEADAAADASADIGNDANDHEALYHEYQLMKQRERESAREEEKTEKHADEDKSAKHEKKEKKKGLLSKLNINNDHATGFAIGAIVMYALSMPKI